MTVVVTAETNVNDVQETKISVPLGEKDADNKNDIQWLHRKEFLGFTFASSVIGLINTGTIFCLYSFTIIQLFAWRKSFEDKWDSDAEKQFDHLVSSLFRHLDVFLLTFILVIISIIGYRDLIKMLRSIGWKRIGVVLGIVTCLAVVLVRFVFPSKTAETFVENILEDEYTLSKTPTSLFYLKFLCIFCSIQHIALIINILWMKFKYVSFISNDNQCSPSSKAVIKEVQMIREDKQEKDEDTIGKDYVIC